MRNVITRSMIERDRKRFIKRCLLCRQAAAEKLRVLNYQARYDRDPELMATIGDLELAVTLIDADLRKAGLVLH